MSEPVFYKNVGAYRAFYRDPKGTIFQYIADGSMVQGHILVAITLRVIDNVQAMVPVEQFKLYFKPASEAEVTMTLQKRQQVLSGVLGNTVAKGGLTHVR